MSTYLSCEKVGYSISNETIPLDYRDDLCNCDTGVNCCNWTILSGVCCDSGVCCPHPTGNILRAVYPWPNDVTNREPILRSTIGDASLIYNGDNRAFVHFYRDSSNPGGIPNNDFGEPAATEHATSTDKWRRYDDYFYKNDDPSSKLEKIWDLADEGAVFKPAGQLLGMVSIRDSAGDEYVNQYAYGSSSFKVFQLYANHGLMPKQKMCEGEQPVDIYGRMSLASGYHEQVWLYKPIGVTPTLTQTPEQTPTWTLVGGYTAAGIPAATTNVVPTTTSKITSVTTTTPGGYVYTTSDGLNVLTPYTTTVTITAKQTSSIVMTTNYTAANTNTLTDTETLTTELIVLSDDNVRLTVEGGGGGHTTYTPLSGVLIQSSNMYDTPWILTEDDGAGTGGTPATKTTEAINHPVEGIYNENLLINEPYIHEPYTSLQMSPIEVYDANNKAVGIDGDYSYSTTVIDGVETPNERIGGFQSYILATDGVNFKRVGIPGGSSPNGFTVGKPFNPLDRYVWAGREQNAPRIYIPTDEECYNALDKETVVNPDNFSETKVCPIPNDYGWADYKKADMSTTETFVSNVKWGPDNWHRREIFDYVASYPKKPSSTQFVHKKRWGFVSDVGLGGMNLSSTFPIDDCGCKQPFGGKYGQFGYGHDPYIYTTLGTKAEYDADKWGEGTQILVSSDYGSQSEFETALANIGYNTTTTLSSRSVHQNDDADKGIELPSEKTVLDCFNKLVEDVAGAGWKVACINDILGDDFEAPDANCREKYTHTEDHKYLVTSTNSAYAATTYHSPDFDNTRSFYHNHPKLPERLNGNALTTKFRGLECEQAANTGGEYNAVHAFDGCGQSIAVRAKGVWDFQELNPLPEQIMPFTTNKGYHGISPAIIDAHNWSLLQTRIAHTHTADWWVSAYTNGRGAAANVGYWSVAPGAITYTFKNAPGMQQTTFTTADLHMTSTAKPGDGVAQWTWTTGKPSLTTNDAGGVDNVGADVARDTPTPVGNLTLTAAYNFGPNGTTLNVISQRYTVEYTPDSIRQTQTIAETGGATGTDTTMTDFAIPVGGLVGTPVGDGQPADKAAFEIAITHSNVGIYMPYFYGRRWSDWCILNDGCGYDKHAGDFDGIWRAQPLRKEILEGSTARRNWNMGQMTPPFPFKENIELEAPCLSCNDASYKVTRAQAMNWLTNVPANNGYVNQETAQAGHGGGTSLGGWTDWQVGRAGASMSQYEHGNAVFWHGTDPWSLRVMTPHSATRIGNLGNGYEPYGGCEGNAGMFVHLREHKIISQANAQKIIDIFNLGLHDWANNSVPAETKYILYADNYDDSRNATAEDNCGAIVPPNDSNPDSFPGGADQCLSYCANCWSSPTSQRAAWDTSRPEVAAEKALYEAGLPDTWLNNPSTFYGVSESDYRKSRCCGGNETDALGKSHWEDTWDNVQCGPIPDEYNKCYLTRTGVYQIGTSTGAFMGAVDGGMYWDDVLQTSIDPEAFDGNEDSNYNFQYGIKYGEHEAEGQTDLGSSRNLTNENFIKTNFGDASGEVPWTTRLEFQNQTCVQPGRIAVTCAGKSGDLDCLDPNNITSQVSGIGTTVGGTTHRRGDVGTITSDWGTSGRTYIKGSSGTYCDDCEPATIPPGTPQPGVNYTGALYEAASGCNTNTSYNSSPDSGLCYSLILPHEDLTGLFYGDFVRNEVPSPGFDGGIPFIDPSDDSQKRIGHDTSMLEGSDFSIFCSPTGGEAPFETKWEFYYPSLTEASPSHQDYREHVETYWTEKFGSLDGLTGWHSLTGEKSGLAFAFLKNPYNEDGTQASWVDTDDSYNWTTDTTTRYTRHIVTDGKNHIDMNLMLNKCDGSQFSGASGNLSMLTIHVPKKFGEDLSSSELLPRAAGGYDSESFTVYNQFYANENQKKDDYRWCTLDAKNQTYIGNNYTDIVRNLLTTKYRATITDKEDRVVTTQTFQILEKRYKPIRLWAPDWIDVEDTTNVAQSAKTDLYNEMWQAGWPNWGTCCALAFKGDQNAWSPPAPFVGSWYWDNLMAVDVFVDTEQINLNYLNYLSSIGQPANTQPPLKIAGTTKEKAFAPNSNCCSDSKPETFDMPLIHNTNTMHEEDGSLAFKIKANEKYGRFHNANLGFSSTYLIHLGDQCVTKHWPKYFITLHHSNIGESYPVASGPCPCNANTDCGPYWNPS